MKKLNLSDVTDFMEHGASRISMLAAVDVNGLNLVLAKQKPGTSVTDVARTAHICLILDGKVSVESGGEHLEAGPGTLIGFDLDEPRVMTNQTDREVTILLINPGARPVHKGAPPAPPAQS